MTEKYKLVELTKEEFSDFVKSKKPNSFLQSPEMFSRYEKTGKEAYLLGLLSEGATEGFSEGASSDKNPIKIAALVSKIGEIKGEKLFSAPSGPILDYEEKNAPELLETFSLEAKKFLKKKRGAVLFLNPDVRENPALEKTLKNSGFKPLGEFLYPKWIMNLDLEKVKDKDAYLASLRKTHRQNVKKTLDRFNLEIRELKEDEFPILVDLCKKAGKKHDFHSQSLEYFKEMKDSFGEKVKFFCAFYEKTPVAAAMFVFYGDEVVYLYSGTDPEFNKYCGSYGLQWFIINRAADEGFKFYNFYGVLPEENNGVYMFKLGFRAELEERAGTFALPLNFVGKLYLAKKKYQKYGEVA